MAQMKFNASLHGLSLLDHKSNSNLLVKYWINGKVYKENNQRYVKENKTQVIFALWIYICVNMNTFTLI